MKNLIKTLTLTAAGLVVGAAVLKRVSSISELEVKNTDGNFVKINNLPLFRDEKMNVDEMLILANEISSNGHKYHWSSL